MKVRGVLFDLDGTLVDHESAAAAALAGWLPELGATPGPDAAVLTNGATRQQNAKLARAGPADEPHRVASLHDLPLGG